MLSLMQSKVGACLGAFVFPYIYHGLGIAAVFYFCALTALLGLALTLAAIPALPGDPDGDGDGAARDAGAPKAADAADRDDDGGGGSLADEATGLLAPTSGS